MGDLTNLAPQVAIVVIFIWYLLKRDELFSRAIEKLTDAINSLERRLEWLEKKS